MLPCYNERAHVLQEIERITAAMDASDLTYEVLCIDDASHRRHARRAPPGPGPLPAPADPAVPPQRRLRHRPADRHPAGPRRDRRLDRRRHDLRERAHPRARRSILRDDDTYDQVVGARTTEEGTHKWARVPAKWIIRKIAEWLTKTKIPDLNSGLRAFRREVSLPYLRLLPAGFSCVTTITMAFLQQPARHQVRADRLRQAGRRHRSSTSSTTPTATSSRCCGWSCTSTRSRCSCRRRCG